jgi:hypothetical protein
MILYISYVLHNSINQVINHPISPRIYGVNFPPNASYINNLGIKISRWGGNTATPYNPFGDFTNAGNDWFFENRANKNADDWIGWVTAAGSDTLLAIPAWVSLLLISCCHSDIKKLCAGLIGWQRMPNRIHTLSTCTLVRYASFFPALRSLSAHNSQFNRSSTPTEFLATAAF